MHLYSIELFLFLCFFCLTSLKGYEILIHNLQTQGGYNMTKKETMSLFKKLFVKQSRSRDNWKSTLQSLRNEEEITPRQEYTWFYFGVSPTI